MSSALAAEKRLEIAANNVANANTIGFRQQRPVFESFLVQTLDGSPSQKGGTAITETVVDRQAGELQQTGNPLDLAIEGDGFFVTRGAAGLMLTRAGNFEMSVDGTLIDPAGNPVLAGSPDEGFTEIIARPEGGPVRVGDDGSITQDGTPLATIAVVTADQAGLIPTGGAQLFAQPQSLVAVQPARVAVGYLEGSNVNPVRGMVELIAVSRDHQSAQKLMNQSRELDKAIINASR
jgi:flagellar basal body rod protein FlgG